MPGQTGQDRSGSAKASQEITKAKYGEPKYRPFTTDFRLRFEYWIGDLLDPIKIDPKNTQLYKAEPDQEYADHRPD